MNRYTTVAKEASAEQVIDRSRFIAHIARAFSKEEADAFIANPGPEYPHFELVAVYREAIPQLKHTGISANESAMRPQCTDEMLIR